MQDTGTTCKLCACTQVADIITPLIAAIYGGQAFTDLYFTVHNSRFLIGDFINNVSPVQALPQFNVSQPSAMATPFCPA